MCGMYPGDVQRSERIVAVLTMLSGEVFDRDRRDTGVDVQPVSDIRVLTRRQLDVDQLYLQQRIHRSQWDAMCSMRRGIVQGRQRLSAVLSLRSGQVRDRDSPDLRVGVQRLSFSRLIWGRQHRASQLYLQRRLHGAGWSRVRVVRGRELQGREWLRCLHVVCTRQVQYSDSRHL